MTNRAICSRFTTSARCRSARSPSSSRTIARPSAAGWRARGVGCRAGCATDPASLRSGTAVRITPPSSPFMRDQAERGRHIGCAASELEILRVSPEHCSGAIGNVTVSDWRGPADRGGDDRDADRAGAVHAREVRRRDRLPRAHRADDAAAGARGPPEDRRRAGDRGTLLQQLRGRAPRRRTRASISRSSRGSCCSPDRASRCASFPR